MTEEEKLKLGYIGRLFRFFGGPLRVVSAALFLTIIVISIKAESELQSQEVLTCIQQCREQD